MKLFSNKQIIKNNFQSLVFPSVMVQDISAIQVNVHIPASVELYDVYEPMNQYIIEETNPMIKTK